MKEILEFLSELSQNNNREWFEGKKEHFQELRQRHEQFIDSVIEGLSTFDPIICTPKAKDCIFRIYRDVRFSHNKDPYKEHFGAFVSANGKKSERPGYYIHIQPGNSFVGGGVYQPGPQVLKKIRQEIYYDSKALKSLLENKEFKKIYPSLYEDKLSRPPKDFDPAFPDIDLIKYKSWFVEHSFTDAEVVSPDFLNKTLNVLKFAVPLNLFMNRAFEL